MNQILESLLTDFLTTNNVTLSEDQLNVLKLLTRGLFNSEIGEALGLSEKRVKDIISSINKKLKTKAKHHILARFICFCSKGDSPAIMLKDLDQVACHEVARYKCHNAPALVLSFKFLGFMSPALDDVKKGIFILTLRGLSYKEVARALPLQIHKVQDFTEAILKAYGIKSKNYLLALYIAHLTHPRT